MPTSKRAYNGTFLGGGGGWRQAPYVSCISGCDMMSILLKYPPVCTYMYGDDIYYASRAWWLCDIFDHNPLIPILHADRTTWVRDVGAASSMLSASSPLYGWADSAGRISSRFLPLFEQESPLTLYAGERGGQISREIFYSRVGRPRMQSQRTQSAMFSFSMIPACVLTFCSWADVYYNVYCFYHVLIVMHHVLKSRLKCSKHSRWTFLGAAFLGVRLYWSTWKRSPFRAEFTDYSPFRAEFADYSPFRAEFADYSRFRAEFAGFRSIIYSCLCFSCIGFPQDKPLPSARPVPFRARLS